MSNRFCWLLASGNEMEHLVPASKQSVESVWHIPDAVCTVLDSWWWSERPSETCRVLLKNKCEKMVHLVGFTIEKKIWQRYFEITEECITACKFGEVGRDDEVNAFFRNVSTSLTDHSIQINQPTRCKNFSSLPLDAHVQLNTFRPSSRPSWGAQPLQWQLLVFRCSVVVAVLLVVVGPVGPATTNNTATTKLQR